MKHEYLETSIWYREEINDPYQVIAEIFSAADIASHRKRIREVLKAACSDHIWRKDNPGDLLYDFKLIESVINAAYLIKKEKKKSPLDIATYDLLNKNLYSDGSDNDWNCFPRSLSKKEYINPYRVFKSFFKYQKLEKWKEELQEILNYALVNMSLSEAGIEMDILSIYIHLTKLIEAAHLIDVREITHVGGHIKNRIAKR
jgi:hypothetical protein